MKTKLSTLFFLFVVFSTSFAQDVITKKDGEKMKVIIKEVTKNTIKYVDFNDPNGVVFTIDKVLVSGVKFKYGKGLNVKNPEKNPYYFADDKVSNIMLNFLAFGSNTLAVSYERALKPGQSYLIEAKIYGAGIKREIAMENSRKGFGLDFSYRLKTKSLFGKGEYRPKHILHGAYFAPEIGFSTGEFVYNDNYFWGGSNAPLTTSHSVVHFGLQYGKQWVLQRKLSIDASLGFHYYVGGDDKDIIRLGNMVGSENKLISFNLRVGFLTGKKKYTAKK